MVPPPEPAPPYPNLDRIIELLRGLDTRQGEGHDDLHRHLNRVEDDMRLLQDLLRNLSGPAAVPPVPPKDDPSVSSPDLKSTVVPLRLPSPSSLRSSISFWSSHHSDDHILAESERDSTEGDHTPTSMSSIATERPAPAIGLAHLRDMVENIRAQMVMVADHQRRTNDQLERLRRQELEPRTDPANLADIQNRLDTIMDILSKLQTPKSPSASVASLTSTDIRDLWSETRLPDIVPPKMVPPPRPVVEDDSTLGAPVLPPTRVRPIQAPPPFTPFITVPGASSKPSKSFTASTRF